MTEEQKEKNRVRVREYAIKNRNELKRLKVENDELKKEIELLKSK